MRAAKGKSKKSSPLKTWEHPAKSSIQVREIINRNTGNDFESSYQVFIPSKLAGSRIRKQFKKKDDAFDWAKKQHDQLLKHGQHHYSLNRNQSEDALKALENLRTSTYPLQRQLNLQSYI